MEDVEGVGFLLYVVVRVVVGVLDPADAVGLEAASDVFADIFACQ